MWHFGSNIENLRYSEYISSLNKRSSDLMEECVYENFRNFDILVIKESIRAGNGSTHLLEIIESELMRLNYRVLATPSFNMYTYPKLSYSMIDNYDYILMNGFYIYEIEKSLADFKNMIEDYLNRGGRIIFTTGIEYTQGSFLKKAKEIVLQTCYPSYQAMRKIVYSHMKEFIEVFERFGKTIYDNVETIQEVEGYLTSIVAFAQLHDVSSYNHIDFQFYKGQPIINDIEGKTHYTAF